MPPAEDLSKQNDDYYWALYIRFLKYLTGDTGKDRMIFICPNSAQGVMGSKVIATAMSNTQIFQKADTLMTSDNPIFAGDRANSYSDWVERYLKEVQLTGDKSQGAKDNVDSTEKAWRATTAELRKTRTQARKEYAEDDDPNKRDIVTWASSNFGELSVALRNEAIAYTNMRQAILQHVGSIGEAWARASKNMENIRDASIVIPGLVMARSSDAGTTAIFQKVKNMEQAGWESLPVATEPALAECTFVPEYTIMEYRSDMDEWVHSYESTQEDSITLEQVHSKEQSETEKKETQNHAHAAASFLGFIRIGSVDHENKETTSSVKSSAEKSDISFKFSWKHHKTFDVIPGSWHVPGLTENFKLKEGATVSTKDFYRPTQFLCVDGLAIEAKLSGSVKSDFETKFADAQSTSGGGGVKINLYGVSGDAGKSTSTERSTHDASYDSSTGTIKLLPRKLYGTSSLLAVVGQKIRT